MSDPDQKETRQEDAASDGSKPSALPLVDSLIQPGGPFPPASLGIRALAYAMDLFLLTTLSTLLIVRFLWPSEFPGAFEEFNQFVESRGAMEPSDLLKEAIAYGQNAMILIFTLYFGLGELFFNGGSLGKRALRLRTVSLVTLEKPSPVTAAIRGMLKALCFVYIPLLVINLLCRPFNRRRLLGHDLVARSIVIDERLIKQK